MIDPSQYLIAPSQAGRLRYKRPRSAGGPRVSGGVWLVLGITQ